MADNLNQYQGDPRLAQGTAGGEGAYSTAQEVMPQTNRMIQQMMYYQFLEKRDRWGRENLLSDRDAKLAGEMSQFELSDWAIPADRDAVMNGINEYNRYFSKYPNAVRLRTDPKTGRVINEAEYSTLQQKRNDVLNMIARANTRTKKYQTIQEQVEKQTIPSKRGKAQDWLNKEAQKPIDQDLVGWPDLEVFNMAGMKPTETPMKIETDDGNVFTTETMPHLPDVETSAAQALINMESNPDSAEMRDALQQQADKWNAAYKQAIENDPNAATDPKALMEQLYRIAPDLANSLANYTDRGILIDKLRARYPEIKNIPRKPRDIHPGNIDIDDVARIIYTNNGDYGFTQELVNNPVPMQLKQLAQQERLTVGGWKHDERMQRIREQNGTTKGTANSAASTKANAQVTLGFYPMLSGQPAQTVKQVSDELFANEANWNDPASIKATNTIIDDMAGKQIYKVKTDGTPLQYMFRQFLQTPYQKVDMQGKSQKTYNYLDELGTYVVVNDPNDPDKNKYVTFYRNPETNIVSSKTLSSAEMQGASDNIINTDGTIKALDQDRQNKDYQNFLQKNKLDFGATVKDLGNALGVVGAGISQPPVSVGQQGGSPAAAQTITIYEPSGKSHVIANTPEAIKSATSKGYSLQPPK